VTFLNIHLNVGKYQAIVAGLALVLTAVQNPDGITSTSTGKGPAVALEKLQGRLAGQYRKRRGGSAEEEAVHDDQQTRAGLG
jgi:ribose 5-phosphate isomerase RpiB